MTSRTLLLLSALALALPAAGCTFHYRIRPEEAARATRALLDQDEVQVKARASDGRQVILRLERGDVLYPLGADGEYLDEGAVRPADRNGLPREEAAGYEFEHFNPGVPLLAGGLGAFGGAVILQSLFAADEPEFAIPLVGPMLAMQKNFTYEEECSDEAMFCGLETSIRRLEGVANLVLLLIQAAGLGVAIGGIVAWDGPPEEAPSGLAAADTLTFTFEPITYGDAGGGGAFTLRF